MMKSGNVDYRIILINLVVLLLGQWAYLVFVEKDTSWLLGVLIASLGSYVLGTVTGMVEASKRAERILKEQVDADEY